MPRKSVEVEFVLIDVFLQVAGFSPSIMLRHYCVSDLGALFLLHAGVWYEISPFRLDCLFAQVVV